MPPGVKMFWFVFLFAGVLSVFGSAFLLLRPRTAPCDLNSRPSPEAEQILDAQIRWKTTPTAFQTALDEWVTAVFPSSQLMTELPLSAEQENLPFKMMVRYYRVGVDVYTAWFFDHGQSIELTGVQRFCATGLFQFEGQRFLELFKSMDTRFARVSK
jgi:hypothetical protein